MSTGAAAGELARPGVSAWRRDRRFFTGMAVAAALTVFAGFARTYYLKGVFGAPPLSQLLHVHGLLFTTWILLFVTQTSLVAARRTDIHRRLGVAGGLLAAVMVVVGLMAAIDAVHRGVQPPGAPPPLIFFMIPFGDILSFGAMVGLGLYFRRRPEVHKRLMLLATITLLSAAIARLPGVLGTGPLVFYALTDLFIAACWLYDRLAHGRIHPTFLWGGLILIALQPIRLWFAGTEAWLAFVRWLTA